MAGKLVRLCVLLAAMVVAVVASGCDLHGDTHEAPLSARQCIDGWNAGTVSWATFGSGPWRATRQSGLVSPGLLVIAGSECRIAFALSGGRYLVVASSGVRQPSDTSHGLQWSLSPGATAAYGVANPVEAGLRLPSLEATRACQEDTGTIRASGCAPHNPAVQPLPIDAIQRRLVGSALRGTPFPYPRTSIYWLGATFHGLGARAVGHQAATSTIGYPVAEGSRLWWVDVVTADPGHPAPHCDSPLRGVPCSRPTLLFTIKDGRSQVSVFSIPIAGVSDHTPLPATLLLNIHNDLAAVPHHVLA